MRTCIQCKSGNTVDGKIQAVNQKCGVVFAPENIKFWSFSVYGGPVIKGDSHACLDCGLIWVCIEPTEISEFVDKNCKTIK